MAGSLRILPFLATACLAVSATVTSCSDERRSYVGNIDDGEHTPTLTTESVRTFISDSGYTRFFIQTPVWYMYDEAKKPFWYFPEGLALDEYDRDMNVIANVVCDTAKYLTQEKLWRLRGNVVMVNTDRDSFLTQLMYWDQNKREVYSDSFVHIVRSDRIIEGYGFHSNENITEYTINKPTGIFPNTMGGNTKADKTAENVNDSVTPPTAEESRTDRLRSRPMRYQRLAQPAEDEPLDPEKPKLKTLQPINK